MFVNYYLKSIDEDTVKSNINKGTIEESIELLKDYYKDASSKLRSIASITDSEKVKEMTETASASIAILHLAYSTLRKRNDYKKELCLHIHNDITQLLASHNRSIKEAYANNGLDISFHEDDEEEA